MTRCASENERPSEGLGWRAPSPILASFETPRLLIRPLALTDLDALFDVIAASRDYLYPWVTWAEKGHRTKAQTAGFIAEQAIVLEKPDTFTAITLAVTLRETGAIVGGTGIHDVRRDTASAETGYWIAADHAGLGYATEACRHTISWALRPQEAGGMGLARIRIYCSDRNEASKHVIEKLRIRKEVEQRADYWLDTLGATTRLGWGVLADEWNCSESRVREMLSE
ncbi:MAG: GNAT family N-acetyltransferase [Planctomycetota bacterium]